jgi:hypothetical protein
LSDTPPKKARGLTDPTEASFNKIFLDYRRKAELAGRKFLLTREEFRHLTKQPCYYCGTPPSRAYKTTKGRQAYTYSGVDKIDPRGDYDLGNSVSSCWTCNNMKSNSTFADFMAHLAKITANLFSKIPLPPKRKAKRRHENND